MHGARGMSTGAEDEATFEWPIRQPADEDFRLDPVRNARRAMTCCTSVGGDGSAGPLAIHVPEGMLEASFIRSVNKARLGMVYVMTSGSEAHFMNSDTLLAR